MYICIFEHMFKIDGGGDRQTEKRKIFILSRNVRFSMQFDRIVAAWF